LLLVEEITAVFHPLLFHLLSRELVVVVLVDRDNLAVLEAALVGTVLTLVVLETLEVIRHQRAITAVLDAVHHSVVEAAAVVPVVLDKVPVVADLIMKEVVVADLDAPVTL
jgi:hypothetical protein